NKRSGIRARATLLRMHELAQIQIPVVTDRCRTPQLPGRSETEKRSSSSCARTPNSRKARVPQRANNFVVVAKIIRPNAQLLNPKPRRAASQQTTIVMIPDFRFAVRQLLKTPGFTTVAMLTLALAIGVNSAIFALVNGVVLKPVVPVRPDEVVNVFTARQNATHDYRPFSYNEYRELRENDRDVFADVAALEFAVAGIGRDHDMRRSFAFLTSENYFPMTGVHPF